jgi:hypothetical protein
MAKKQIIIFLLIVLPVVTAWYAIIYVNDIIVRNVNQEISKTTKIIAYEQENWILRTEKLLEVISILPIVQGSDLAKCDPVLAEINRIYAPQYTTFGVIKPDGELLCADAPFSANISIADRPWFKRLLETKTFTIGEFIIGGVTEKPTIVFAYPVLNEKQNIKYVTAAGLDLGWLESLLREVPIMPATELTIIDHEGIVLAEYSLPDGLIDKNLIGKKLMENDLLAAIFKNRVGTLETKGADGVRRIYSFTSLSEEIPGPIFILGIPFFEIKKHLLTIIWPGVIVSGVTIFAVLGLIWYFRRGRK